MVTHCGVLLHGLESWREAYCQPALFAVNLIDSQHHLKALLVER